MRTIIHKADSRGYADHGWLKSHHTFSFAGYNNPQRMHFGALRVLNDDFVAGGNGFGRHPHSNMEFRSSPLERSKAPSDGIGNGGTSQRNEIQVLSAGAGVAGSECNGSEVESVNFLQICLVANKERVPPVYHQGKIDPAGRKS